LCKNLLDLQKDYAFGYDVNELDEYGNPNVHSRTEVREGPHVKGRWSRRNHPLPDQPTSGLDT
jgi:hypothetical protein